MLPYNQFFSDLLIIVEYLPKYALTGPGLISYWVQ